MPSIRHRFERLFDQSTDAAYVVDPVADEILAANAAGCAMLGYTQEELLLTPVSAIHPAELPQLRQLVDTAVREGQATTIKLTCRTKQGVFLPTEMLLLALDSDGRRCLLGLVHDRSEHRQPDPHQ
jgi:two-component system, chemotaxis family, sensor kinase Cph1